MPITFTKLFTSITESTVWMQPHPIRLVWITMLAMADRNGRVFASIPGLAHRARVEIAETEEALSVFLSPDPYSRTVDHEGRRIEAIDGGWRLLNHGKYRAILDEEAVKESKREWAARHRAEEKSASTSSTVDSDRRPSAHTDADSDTDSNTNAVRGEGEGAARSPRKPSPGGNGGAPKRFVAPDVGEVEAWVREKHPDWLRDRVFNPVKFVTHYIGNGWKVGRNPMKDWKATASSWVASEDERRAG